MEFYKVLHQTLPPSRQRQHFSFLLLCNGFSFAFLSWCPSLFWLCPDWPQDVVNQHCSHTSKQVLLCLGSFCTLVIMSNGQISNIAKSALITYRHVCPILSWLCLDWYWDDQQSLIKHRYISSSLWVQPIRWWSIRPNQTQPGVIALYTCAYSKNVTKVSYNSYILIV